MPHLPNGSDDKLIPIPMTHRIKALVLGLHTIYDSGAVTVTLASGVPWIFGSFDNRACFKDV